VGCKPKAQEDAMAKIDTIVAGASLRRRGARDACGSATELGRERLELRILSQFTLQINEKAASPP
jgi:hypothetical protein